MSNKIVTQKLRKINLDGLIHMLSPRKNNRREGKRERTHEEQMEYMRKKSQQTPVNPLFFWSNY